MAKKTFSIREAAQQRLNSRSGSNEDTVSKAGRGAAKGAGPSPSLANQAARATTVGVAKSARRNPARRFPASKDYERESPASNNTFVKRAGAGASRGATRGRR